jgi:uncharacterized protein (DUF169 family)
LTGFASVGILLSILQHIWYADQPEPQNKEEEEMPAKAVDLSIFKKFEFERPPVGVKYTFTKPELIKRITKKMRICEMLPEAWEGDCFYAAKEDMLCVGPIILGMVEHDSIFESGHVGPKMQLFDEPRVNQALYRAASRLPKDSAKFVSFCPLDKIAFDPDVLVITANSPAQAAIFMRALTYSSLNVFSSRTAPALGCSWVYAYPYLTGETNYVVTPVGFGTGTMPDGLVIISVPYQLLPRLVATLKKGNWVPEWINLGRDELHIEADKVVKELEVESGEKSKLCFL